MVLKVLVLQQHLIPVKLGLILHPYLELLLCDQMKRWKYGSMPQILFNPRLDVIYGSQGQWVQGQRRSPVANGRIQLMG